MKNARMKILNLNLQFEERDRKNENFSSCGRVDVWTDMQSSFGPVFKCFDYWMIINLSVKKFSTVQAGKEAPFFFLIYLFGLSSRRTST